MKHVQLPNGVISTIATVEEMADAIRYSKPKFEVICLVDSDHYWETIKRIKEDLLTQEERKKIGETASIITIDDYLKHYAEVISYMERTKIDVLFCFYISPEGVLYFKEKHNIELMR